MNRIQREYQFNDGKILTLGNKINVMGILNLSQDSFSDRYIPTDFESMKQKLFELINHGADIIDIGAQSTRPNYEEISITEEIDRLRFLPELVKISTVPVSIDTYRAEVAEFAAEAGIHLLNDIHGLQNTAAVAKKFNLPVICMSYEKLAEDALESVKRSFHKILTTAEKFEIDSDKIILDPGIGFGKSADDDLNVIANIDKIKMNYPMLLGVSRKSFIGKKLDLDIDNRVEATGAVCIYAALNGVEIVRVHDVLQISRMCRMIDEVLKFTR